MIFGHGSSIRFDSIGALGRIGHLSDTYGPVESGFVKLQGHLYKLKCSLESSPLKQRYAPLYVAFGGRTFENDNQLVLYPDEDISSIVPQSEPVCLCAFPLSIYHIREFLHMHVLMLRPTGKKDGMFSRIGVLYLFHEAAHHFLLTYKFQQKLVQTLFESSERIDPHSISISYTIKII